MSRSQKKSHSNFISEDELFISDEEKCEVIKFKRDIGMEGISFDRESDAIDNEIDGLKTRILETKNENKNICNSKLCCPPKL